MVGEVKRERKKKRTVQNRKKLCSSCGKSKKGEKDR